METNRPTEGGTVSWNLRQFILRAEMQQDESRRINELPAPKSDDDAVHIMTMHSAKGLEFPIAILRDLDYVPRTDAPVMLVDPDTGGAAVSIGSSSSGTQIRTPEYADLAQVEADHRVAEEVRLAYVAATRARDHLLVSRHCQRSSHGTFPTAVIEAISEQSEALPHSAIDMIPDAPASPTAPGQTDGLAALTYDAEEWQQERNASIDDRSLPQAVTATWLARQAGSDNVTV